MGPNDARCNDRLFPSTSQPRAPGDTSFTPQRKARGCCGDVPEHDHATPVTSFHDSAFEPQVLLIDAGSEWQGYASDVTRTVPVGNGGRYTERGGEVYEIVLRMQKVGRRLALADERNARIWFDLECIGILSICMLTRFSLTSF
jgi:hypothetical protein